MTPEGVAHRRRLDERRELDRRIDADCAFVWDLGIGHPHGLLSAWFCAYSAFMRLAIRQRRHSPIPPRLTEIRPDARRYAKLRQDGFTARDALGQVRTYNWTKSS